MRFIDKYIGRGAYSLFLLTTCMMGCAKMVEVDLPITSLTGEATYSEDGPAIGVITGIYVNMSNELTLQTGITSLSVFPGLSADELRITDDQSDVNYIAYYRNKLAITPALGTTDFWKNIFPYVYSANSVIKGVTGATALTPAVKMQMLGEAKFVRAFCYFYLVNLYGDVPLALTPDYQKNATLARISKADIYKQILADLLDAKSLLSDNYLNSTLQGPSTERIRPNRWAATALLARVYLYLSDYAEAEKQSLEVINNTSLYNLVDLNTVFLKNNREAIWQLQPVSAGMNTQIGYGFILPDTGPSGAVNGSQNPVYLNTPLLNSFEAGDGRKSSWINSVMAGGKTYYYAYKYKKGAPYDFSLTTIEQLTEYMVVLRLSEQYLICAEARARQGNIEGSKEMLNAIRRRASLGETTSDTPQQLVDAVMHERQVELFTEWGHRWLDLKRTGTVDSVMNIITPQKGGAWNSYQQYYPIPLYELQNNPALQGHQNTGY